MTQVSLFQEELQTSTFSVLCNALYERELRQLSNRTFTSALAVQSRLKSLPYYINRTAHLMSETKNPLCLDVQNANWSAKQERKMPLLGQETNKIELWYSTLKSPLGLVVPVVNENYIILDCIDRVDHQKQRIHTNVAGWFYLDDDKDQKNKLYKLLIPTKKVMSSACAGHCWQESGKMRPIIPSLRELLLSCSINWRNFKQPLDI